MSFGDLPEERSAFRAIDQMLSGEKFLIALADRCFRVYLSCMNIQIIYPVLAMATLTILVGGFLLFTRVSAVRRGLIKIKYFRTYNEGSSTEHELKASQHFSNMFEMPVLFYVAAIIAMVLPVQGNAIVATAWIFFGSRVAHAYTHIGPNRILPRMFAFFVGVFAVAAMLVQILISVRATQGT
jgi:hypothetical protein